MVTSGALTGRTFFLRASIQLRRMPEVIADRVKTASFVCNREATEALSVPSRGADSSHSLPETPRHPLARAVDSVKRGDPLSQRLLGSSGGVGVETHSLRGSPLQIIHETISKQRQKKLCRHFWPNVSRCNPAVQVLGAGHQCWGTAAGHRETQTVKCPALHTHRNTIFCAALAATSHCYSK